MGTATAAPFLCVMRQKFGEKQPEEGTENRKDSGAFFESGDHFKIIE